MRIALLLSFSILPLLAQDGQIVRQSADPVPVAVQHVFTVNGSNQIVAHTLRAEGADASEDGTGRGTPLVAFNANRGQNSDLGAGPQCPPRAMDYRDGHVSHLVCASLSCLSSSAMRPRAPSRATASVRFSIVSRPSWSATWSVTTSWTVGCGANAVSAQTQVAIKPSDSAARMAA